MQHFILLKEEIKCNHHAVKVYYSEEVRQNPLQCFIAVVAQEIAHDSAENI